MKNKPQFENSKQLFQVKAGEGSNWVINTNESYGRQNWKMAPRINALASDVDIWYKPLSLSMGKIVNMMGFHSRDQVINKLSLSKSLG